MVHKNIVIAHYCAYTACVHNSPAFDSFFFSIYWSTVHFRHRRWWLLVEEFFAANATDLIFYSALILPQYQTRSILEDSSLFAMAPKKRFPEGDFIRKIYITSYFRRFIDFRHFGRFSTAGSTRYVVSGYFTSKWTKYFFCKRP